MLSACRVPVCALAATAAASSGGCVIPPDLEPAGADAGPSTTPVILGAQPAEFAFPGPMVLDRGVDRPLTLEVADDDLGDTIYVQLYVDYNREVTGGVPTPAWASCQAAATGQVTRFVECPTQALCTPIAEADLGDHVLEAMVADRPFIPDSDPLAAGQPPYRALAEPGRAAYSFRSWVMRCNPADEI